MFRLTSDLTAVQQNQRIAEALARDQERLRRFIRRRVSDAADAEDILQDVFFELVEAERLMKPIKQVSAWLFRVARNRITDLFRKRRPDASTSQRVATAEDGEELLFEDLLPSTEAGPEARYARDCSSKNLAPHWTSSQMSSATCLLRTSSKDAASKSWRPRPV